jgi:ribonuclease P protein component
MSERDDGVESFRFPRNERLKKREGIRSVFNGGRLVTCFGARLFFLRNGREENRIAFTFARKFGNAVERNSARRLGREAYRRLRAKIKNGYDLVLLVYPVKIDFWGRLKQLETLFSMAGLFEACEER